jgi:2-polyprenyl-3-methyl-5-hydroxy-6-metoxy-1,4-benzoquinol methylase
MSQPYGFRIDEYIDLQGWKVVELSGVPLTQVSACPADGSPLATLCVLSSQVDSTRIRIGCCEQCGHVTYIDRPTEQWIYKYYFETWDSAAERGTDEGRAAVLDKLSRMDPSVESTAVRLARGLAIDRTRPVCEIGCGFGAGLRQLAASGYTRVAGIEASRHRAEIARAGGFDVLTTPFETSDTRAALLSRGPFGVILTSHALEHTYHPDAVFAAAAALQDTGGHLIISVPNQEGEPTMGVLMFLPHLHSFTAASLAQLAARHGYEVVDATASSAKNLNVVFRRTQHPAAVPPPQHPYRQAVNKILSALDLDRRHAGRRRLWWARRADIAGQIWAGPPATIGEWKWQRFMDEARIERPRSILISSLRGNGGRSGDPPIQIQFRNSVALFFK